MAITAGPPGFSNSIDVKGVALAPISNTVAAGSGITIAGCVDFATNTCRLAHITDHPTGAVTPAMYLDTTNGVQIGLLTAAQATTAVASLPLQHANGTPEHLVVSPPLQVTDSAATLSQTQFFLQGDRVDTNLVTHGMLVPMVDVPVFSGKALAGQLTVPLRNAATTPAR